MNARTRFLHLAADEETLRCGKKWPLRREILPSLPLGAQLCERCF